MDTQDTVNFLAVGLAALSMFLIGGAWYSVLFPGAWQRAAGLSSEALQSGAARVFVGSLVLALVIAGSLAAFIGSQSVAFGTVVGAVAGLTFFAAPLWIVYLFERRSLALAAINGGYGVVSFTVMGLIVGALQ
ncbi:DUF1761 domain-containing protein [Demequina sp.]|uniref:DUF1761 domain-containing protein n=1 Tax=Demequina sp. TaxID=2050685 RepID=UPI0025C3152A|nr:DUF1761 domain-containing protein [Demequina sp.]